MSGCIPHFLCIGAQKSGTTTLHKALNNHPDIFVPPEKELHYFTNNYNEGKEWYLGKFKEAKAQQIKGEITPYYLFHHKAPERIKKLTPKVKLIALLRDPVERAVSQYYHSVNLGFENLCIEDALSKEEIRIKSGNQFSHQKHSYVSRSKYIEQLERYENLFKNEQILVIKSEQLFNDQDMTLRKIFNFLGVDPNRKESIGKRIKEYAKGGKAISEELKRKLQSELKQTNAKVREKYNFGWEW